MSRYRQAFDDLVVELIEQRLTSERIATGLGVHPATIGRVRARRGISGHGRPDRIDVERVVLLTQAGWSIPRIAEEMGICEKSVSRGRREAGISLPGRCSPALDEQQRATAERLLDDGASYSDVARTIGCDRETVRRNWPGRGWSRQQVLEFMWVNRHAALR